MTMTFNLLTGTQVYCTDQDCGKVAHLVVDPDSRQVTDVVVEYGLPFFKHNRVFPYAAIRSVIDDSLHLAIASSDWNAYPEYREVEVEEPDPTANSNLQSMNGGALEYRMPMVRRQFRQGVAAERAVLHAGRPIHNHMGSVGQLDHLLVKRRSGEITHVAMRRGLLQREYILIPADQVTFSSDGHLLIDLTRDELSDLPHYQHAGEDSILVDLEQYLRDETSAFANVHANIRDGVLYLTGHVPSRTLKYHATELARTIPGVGEVENRLEIHDQRASTTPAESNRVEANEPVQTAPRIATFTADRFADEAVSGARADEPIDELAAEVDYALSVDQRLQGQAIAVRNEQGIIHLRGHVSNIAQRQTAANLAANQPGVSKVVNELVVQGGDAARPKQADVLTH